MSDHIATPRDFANPVFAERNSDLFDEFILLRIKGYSPTYSLRVVFGEEYIDNQMMARIFSMERNPYYKRKMASLMEKTDYKAIWGPKMAVHELASLVRDMSTKDSVRFAAIKELNVLYEITVVDEKGNTKAGRSLADFYRENGMTLPGSDDVAATPADEDKPTTH